MFQYFRHFHVAKLGKILPASKEIPAKGELLTFSTGTQQPVVPDADKTSWWYMHEKSPDKLYTRNGQFFPLSLITVILYRKGNGIIIHTDDAVITDGNAVSIFAHVFNY